MLADARPAAILARVPLAVMLTDARPAALLAHASYAVVLADARPAALLARPSLTVVLADARSAALLANALIHASLAVVRALCAPLIRSASTWPRPAHSLPTLRPQKEQVQGLQAEGGLVLAIRTEER